MPDLKRMFEWRRWEPGLGGNRELPVNARFYFELGVGLTKVEIRALDKAIHADVDLSDERKAIEELGATEMTGEEKEAALVVIVAKVDAKKAAHLAAALEPYVRMGAEPLRLNGVDIKTVGDYLAAVASEEGEFHATELVQALRNLNKIEGTRELFSERLSGGTSTTSRAGSR